MEMKKSPNVSVNCTAPYHNGVFIAKGPAVVNGAFLPHGLMTTHPLWGEYVDDSDAFPGRVEDGNNICYPASDIVSLGLPLYPQAACYGVGYGLLVACDHDGVQIAVWFNGKWVVSRPWGRKVP